MKLWNRQIKKVWKVLCKEGVLNFSFKIMHIIIFFNRINDWLIICEKYIGHLIKLIISVKWLFILCEKLIKTERVYLRNIIMIPNKIVPSSSWWCNDGYNQKYNCSMYTWWSYPLPYACVPLPYACDSSSQANT